MKTLLLLIAFLIGCGSINSSAPIPVEPFRCTESNRLDPTKTVIVDRETVEFDCKLNIYCIKRLGYDNPSFVCVPYLNDTKVLINTWDNTSVYSVEATPINIEIYKRPSYVRGGVSTFNRVYWFQTFVTKETYDSHRVHKEADMDIIIQQDLSTSFFVDKFYHFPK